MEELKSVKDERETYKYELFKLEEEEKKIKELEIEYHLIIINNE